MAEQIIATKGNLMSAKKFLAISKLGYDLLDRKRNILIREMMECIDKAKKLRGTIDSTYKTAYDALATANITMGVVAHIAEGLDIYEGIAITYRSVMGVEVPVVRGEENTGRIGYGLHRTNSQFDEAYVSFNEVRRITIVLAELENAIYRIAKAVKKTQMRANALKNILIPKYQNMVVTIQARLDENEREEFSRLKVIKARKA
jgi:V/A-type H+-transporting ATPase subunit D